MPEPTDDSKEAEAKDDTPSQNAEKEDSVAGTGGSEETEKSVGIPAGIIPLFFSGAGQQLFECVVDKDLTTENPSKLIPKEKILEDFKNRAAVSDFHPVKKKVQGYDGEELLVVYDYDFKYGENFYICVTEEAKELILNPPEAKKEGVKEGAKKETEEEEDEIPKTPEPKEWECLYSDVEIKEGQFTNERPLLKWLVSRKRRHFESPHTFTSALATRPNCCVDISSLQVPDSDLYRRELEKGVQAVPETVESQCQTEWLKPCNVAVQYAPRLLPEAEVQNILNDVSMQEFLERVCPRVEVSLQQNMIMNLLVDDFELLSDTGGITGKKSDTNLKEYQSFADLCFSKSKIITWVEWHPTIKGIIAVSCGDNASFDDRVDLSTVVLRKQSLILIWSFTDPIHPVLFLEAPDTVLCFRFNPSDPNLIVGGCINGQVVMWNIEEYQDRVQINKISDSSELRSNAAAMAIFDTDRKLDHAPMVQYCVTASIKDGHSREVCDVQWIPHTIEICHKTGDVLENPTHQCNQIISCSIDGSVMVWDIRPPVQKVYSQSSTLDMDYPYNYLDLKWKPFIKIPMPRTDSPGKYSATRISIRESHTELPKDSEENTLKKDRSSIGLGTAIEGASSMFFVGTEDGEVVYCDWKPTKDLDTGKLVAPLPSFYFHAHTGAVSCVERSPFFRDILLTIGGCTWAIWKEGAQSGYLLLSSCSSVPFAGGVWSPTRPGVFFVIKKNGNVDVWDLIDRSHEALVTQNISSYSLTSIFPWQLTSKQYMLAVGDSAGTLHILEIPWNLSQPSTNEISIMEAFLHRQVERLQFTKNRMKKRDSERKSIDAEAFNQPKEERATIPEMWEDKAKKDYDNYLSMELKLLIQLGVIQSGTVNPDD